MEGVRISTDYSLTGIDPGGYFEITQRGSEGRRRLEIEPASSGGLRQSFFVNGQKSESKAEAEELLQEALQTLRRIDHDRERVHQELESVHEAQAQAREEMERGRLEMQHAMRDALGMQCRCPRLGRARRLGQQFQQRVNVLHRV